MLRRNIDYAMLVKMYGYDNGGKRSTVQRNASDAREIVVTGRPDPKHISTSLRRTPESNDAHVHAAIHATNERIEQESGESLWATLCTTCTIISRGFTRLYASLPAMEAGIADHVWSIEEIADLLDENNATMVAGD